MKVVGATAAVVISFVPMSSAKAETSSASAEPQSPFKFEHPPKKVEEDSLVYRFVTRPFVGLWETVSHYIMGESKPLLDAEAPDPFGHRPRTLVLGWDKTLVYNDYTHDEGWKTRKRPYVDQFLAAAHKAGYEIVVWSSDSVNDAEGVLVDFDAANFYLRKRLYREHLNLTFSGSLPGAAKDLSRLNRDLSRVIVIDSDACVASHPVNLIKISEFKNDSSDEQLAELVPFLQRIQQHDVPDVRSFIEKFNEVKQASKVNWPVEVKRPEYPVPFRPAKPKASQAPVLPGMLTLPGMPTIGMLPSAKP